MAGQQATLLASDGVSSLHHFVSVLSDDEDRTWSVAHDPFGRAAHEHMFKAGVAVSRNDDKIGLAIAGDVRDDFECCSYLHDYVF